MTKESKWILIEREHEGFPLFLRHPGSLDYDRLQLKFPLRFVLTHTFSFRKFDGLPEPKYNNMLEEFDVFVTGYFEDNKEGQIVLVETFGGERSYYFYISESVEPEKALKNMDVRFPGLKLEVSSAMDDPTWRFIRQYSEDFLQSA